MMSLEAGRQCNNSSLRIYMERTKLGNVATDQKLLSYIRDNYDYNLGSEGDCKQHGQGATNKRYEIYKKFKKYVQEKDERPMDEICATGPIGFALQAQQQFLREYMLTYPSWKKLLLYHEIGSGKTCTAITMAEEYLRMNPQNHVRVILPARLKTNFIDELISPCGMETYLSQDEFTRYMSSETSVSHKKALKARFTKAIESRYDIQSFEKLKIKAMKHKQDLIAWAQDFTKDALIIVDEVHNLLSDKYEVQKAKTILTSGRATKGVKGMNTILLKVIAKHAHPTAKMVFMTATPIFDNITQVKELVSVMEPSVTVPKEAKISDVINHLRGKVSYFPGTSVNAYPKVEYEVHHIPLSHTQDELTSRVMSGDEDDELKEEFMSKQRQISLACLPDNESVKNSVEDVLDDLNEYCPKIKQLVDVIAAKPGKHVVFSNFVGSGLKIVEAALRKEGWVSLKESIAGGNSHKGKVYAVWDGSVKDADKQSIKSIANAQDNIFGDHLRVILGSPSIKEGVSFKHIQHIHLLDPVWNISAKAQVEGRAIRYCSHSDIKAKHSPLKRVVVVHIYKSVPRKDGLVKETCDQVIYDDIIERKKKLIKAGESALKKVAIDHYLFRNMYSVVKMKTPQTPPNSAQSNIGLTEEEDVHLGAKHANKKRNTCPKARRPKEGECPNSMFVRKNNQGFDCCYKSKGKSQGKPETKPSTCPKKRIPVDGKCPDGFKIKANKVGEPCCYKVYKKKTTVV